MKLLKLMAVLIVCVMLQACLSGPPRNCPAYNLTGDDIWVPGLVGTIYRYSNQSGDSEEYVISEVNMKPAHLSPRPRRGVPVESISCTSFREVIMLSSDGVQGLRLLISHLDWPRFPSEFDISVSLVSFTLNGEDRTYVQKIGFWIHKIQDMGLGKWGNHSYNETLDFNGRSYEHVLSVFAADEDFSDDPDTKNSPNAIKRFVVARGDGLIQFERNVGSVFNLVSVER